jgi:hypothetical protein
VPTATDLSLTFARGEPSFFAKAWSEAGVSNDCHVPRPSPGFGKNSFDRSATMRGRSLCASSSVSAARHVASMLSCVGAGTGKRYSQP